MLKGLNLKCNIHRKKNDEKKRRGSFAQGRRLKIIKESVEEIPVLSCSNLNDRSTVVGSVWGVHTYPSNSLLSILSSPLAINVYFSDGE